MSHYGWEIPEREVTPENQYLNRRRFLRSLGALGLIGMLPGCSSDTVFKPGGGPNLRPGDDAGDLGRFFPASLNADFGPIADRPLTNELIAATYNNFIEFTESKSAYRISDALPLSPWTVEISGLVQKPRIYDVEQLLDRVTMEERIYRHRCVEAWSMVVPWTGFPLNRLIDIVQPLSSARYVSFTTFFNPDVAPVQKADRYPWAYTEGLTMAEATNELTLLVAGIYGHELPTQHGAPLRLIVPWKYGYKGIKSIVRIEFTAEQPATFWNIIWPEAYGFESNVDPTVPHPNWSQAEERLLGIRGPIETLPYNGYSEYVAHLYT